jgi:hypothetical protein
VDEGWTFNGGWNRNGVNGFQARVTTLASPPVLGFRWWDRSYDQGTPGQQEPVRVYGVVVPMWAVVLPLLTCSAAALARWRREHVLRLRLADHKCSRCGYDLRATPGQCPECGVATGAPGKAV